jgi:hypothetical protein
MAKTTRWVVYETPVFVRVEYDDEYEGEDVTKVILVDEVGDMYPMREPLSGQPVVLNENFELLAAPDRTAVSAAGATTLWPEGHVIIPAKGWDHGPDPRRDPDWYLDIDDEHPGDEHLDDEAPDDD